MTREERQQYYIDNKERIRTRQKAHYAANRVRINAKARLYERARAEKRRIERAYADYNREHKEGMKVLSMPIEPPPDWYTQVRLNVQKGISTFTLSPEDQDKFWNEFSRRVGMET
jgi:hypothetical protein